MQNNMAIPEINGLTFPEISKLWDKDPWDCYFDILAANAPDIGSVVLVSYLFTDEHLFETISCPLYMLVVDGYSTSAEGLYVHLYHASELNWHLHDGTKLKVTQKTNYPWDGRVEIAVDPAVPCEFTVFVRVPGWTRSAQVDSRPAPTPGEYLPIRRRWQSGDRIVITFEMQPQLIAANPRVPENTGKAAIERGPLVYCMEAIDQKGIDSLYDVSLPVGPDPSRGFSTEFRPDLLGGVTVLKHRGAVLDTRSSEQPLYSPLAARKAARQTELTFIPYYAFANRQPTAMQVWMRYFVR
jgi:DUF1680 family protein